LTGNLLHRGAGAGFARQWWGSGPVHLQDNLLRRAALRECRCGGQDHLYRGAGNPQLWGLGGCVAPRHSGRL